MIMMFSVDRMSEPRNQSHFERISTGSGEGFFAAFASALPDIC